MKNFHGLEQIWTIKQKRNGRILWAETKKNIIPDEGEKALVDTFYRGNSATYFATANFYVGLYYGSIAENTTLLQVFTGLEPPVTNGYARVVIERSNIGWPTIEVAGGDWRVVSKMITITADGGSIGPVNGAFLCTSSNQSGVLIGGVAMSMTRTIPAGDVIEFSIRAKQK